MNSTSEELRNPGEDEGIVFGSLIINVAKSTEEESGWAFLKGQVAADATYEALIWERGNNPLKKSYLLLVTPEIEEYFVRKLPAGDYEIREIRKKGLSTLVVHIGATFTVTPGQTVYIGRLAVQLPHRITMGSPVRMKVVDAQIDTTAKIGTEYGVDLSSNIAALMAVKRQ